MNLLKAAIDTGEEDVGKGKTRRFSGDEFATCLSERAEQITRTKR